MHRLVIGAMMLALAGSAGADVTATALHEAVGDWRLSEVGGKVACTLSLTGQVAPEGFEVRAPLACRRAFPPLKDLADWAMDDKGAIVLTNAQHQKIIVFPEVSGGSYEAKAPDGHTWRLEPLRGQASTPATPMPGSASPPVVGPAH